MENYKSSKYNIINEMKSGDYLVFNTLSSCVAIMSKEETEELLNGSISDQTVLNECRSLGFIVPKEEDELGKVVALRNMNNFNMNRAGFQVLPTTGCNARCFYCYEKDFVCETMSEEIVIQSLEFIKGVAAPLKELSIAWFGGEPLLRFDIIETMSMDLMNFCEERGIEYSSNMITNAVLMSDEIISKLKKYKINTIQITIDGKGTEHDRRKNYLSEDVGYSDIIETIGKLVRAKIKVLVRLNIDKDNYKGCLEALDDLKEECGNGEYIWPYIAPLYSDVDASKCFNKEELEEVFTEGYRKLIDCGYIQSVNGLPMNFTNASCCATMINNYVIAPSGIVSKCEHLIGNDEDVVGNIYDGVIFNNAMVSWTDTSLPEECGDCEYLPICQAGCRAAVTRGFGYGRCSYIRYTTGATVKAAEYLLKM